MTFRKGHQPWNKGIKTGIIPKSAYKPGDNAGSNHPMWNGGKTMNAQGYVLLSIGGGKQVLEHRFIMEKHIGRKLLRREHVHHINGVKTDNRIDNLKIVDWSDHGREHASNQWRVGGSLWKIYN